MAGPVRYWEDLEVGQEFQLGSKTFTQEEIVAFARDWDPQFFHVDADAARRSEYGGLIASGFHTGSAAMRLVADGWLNAATSIGSPGLDELRWLKPVRPGDTISVRLRVLETRASQSKPHLGVSLLGWTISNQHGETVMTVKAINLIRRRSGGSP